MTATVSIRYFELLDHWPWEVTVNYNNEYGYEDSYEQAFEAARDALEDMLEEADG